MFYELPRHACVHAHICIGAQIARRCTQPSAGEIRLNIVSSSMSGSPVVKDLKTKTANVLALKSDYVSTKSLAARMQSELTADLKKAKKAFEKKARKVDSDGWKGCQSFRSRWAVADELHDLGLAQKEVATMLNVLQGTICETDAFSQQVVSDIAKETSDVMVSPFK
jgi:hypothetical protein